MSDQHVAYVQGGGWKYSINLGSELASKIQSYINSGYSISCVAVGKNKRYAVVCTNGVWSACGPQEFLDKMGSKSIKKQNIKHISFGPRDCYAITMKGGWCHAKAFSNCLNKINEHNGKISYVSMTSLVFIVFIVCFFIFCFFLFLKVPYFV